MKTVFTARRLYTPVEEITNPLLVIEDGLITEIFSRASQAPPANAALVDFGDAALVPGFLDIHIHGGAGLDVMQVSAAELPRLGQFLISHGVTGYFATTVAAPLDCNLRGFGTAGGCDREAQTSQLKALQKHARSGFISKDHSSAISDVEFTRLSICVEPTVKIFEKLWQAARGHVRMMTIAPEIPGAMEVIAEAARRKVCVSIGHSDAELSVAREAVRNGARHATHTFNAMRPLDHRDPGDYRRSSQRRHHHCRHHRRWHSCIARSGKVFLQAKGPERAVLITDAISATGMPDGRYQLGPIEVEVKDGKATAGDSLAGSVLTMDRAVRNVTKFSNWTLPEAVRAATLNPAKAVGLAAEYGKLAAGVEATFVVLSAAGDVLKTIVGGRGL